MSAELKTIIWFLLTISLMAFFAGVEMAYYSANRLSIELKRNQGTKAGLLLGKFVDNPTRFIGMTLIGFNFFLVFLGLQISTVMQPVWLRWRVGSDLVHIIVEIILATLLVLILAEFLPRAWFRARSNSQLSRFAGVIDVFYQVAGPVADKLTQFAAWLLKYVFNVRLDKHKDALSHAELKNLFQQQETDERQDRNTQLLENAQEFPKVRIRQCLVPRKEIVGVPIDMPIEQVRNKLVETKLSKLVVYEENIDHIVGYIHQIDLFKKPGSINEVLLAIPAVPESMSAADLMSKFSRERRSIAWVVDEFGGTAGIITMEDVLEELFGEIEDEYDTEKFVEKQLAENEYIFSGRLELDYLEEKYGLHFPENESETLSGYIINFHETIPRQKERIIIDNYEFDVVNVSDTRIETVKLKKLK
jgi:CBS domain containing-hemolysin-like protein